ncbi:MAG: tetratricopeptide repeat protein [Methanosarcinales archaeon]|nr:tetratricopeptide repeat protein [Methanosarcinales archaeon]
MELTGEHLLTLDELITLLSISEDFTIVFVRCNELVLRNTLSTTIEQRMHDDIYIYNIKMGEDATNLLQLLNDAVTSELYISLKEENKKIAFFIYGLDEAVEKKNPQGKSEALLLLNMMREDFQKIQHPLIIWINKASLILILKEAQDFFSWRTTVFEFDMELKIETRPLTDFGETDLVSLTREELENRWDYYCGLLKENKEKGINNAYKSGYWSFQLGMIKLLMGYAEESVKYFKESLIRSREIGDKRSEETKLGNLGIAYSALGEIEKAIGYYEQALAISKEIGDKYGEGSHIGNLGNAYHTLSKVEKAIEYYNQALAISKKIGDKHGEGMHLGNLGNAYSALGKVEIAIEYYNQALAISKEIGDRRGEGTHIGNLGSAYRYLGEVEKAIEYYNQALAISKEIGDKHGEGTYLGNLGSAYDNFGEVGKAIEYYEQALAISKEIRDRRSEGTHLGNLGSAYRYLGKVEKAIEYYKQALGISKEIGDRRGEGNWLGNLGIAYSSLGDTEKAIKYFNRALAIGNQIQDPKIINYCKKHLNSLTQEQNSC